LDSNFYNIPFAESQVSTYASYSTDLSPLNSLYLSKMDAGYRIIRKSSPSVLIEGYNLSKGSTWLQVYYAIDGGNWSPWGNADGVTNVINVSGVNELRDPKGNGSGTTTLEYRWIQLRIDFHTAYGNLTPVLESVTLRAIMRPLTSYGWSFHVYAQPDIAYGPGMTEKRSPKEIIMDLRQARDSGAPIQFIDAYKDTHQVYVTSINELAGDKLPGLSKGAPNITAIIAVNIVAVDGARYPTASSGGKGYSGPPVSG
jgi:hypothetical protein